jgi:dipicolinate synthase subunit B
MRDKKVGFALTGSFCTFKAAIACMEEFERQGADIYPIMSQTAAQTDTRFGTADEIKHSITHICEKPIMHTIYDVEPIGPKSLLDVLIIAPCTGNTLGKLAGGITDTAVTMAAKAQLRNGKPVVLAISTNDGLAASSKNIAVLMNTKNYYFVPYKQDDPENKPNSLVADFSWAARAVDMALEGKQVQPILV